MILPYPGSYDELAGTPSQHSGDFERRRASYAPIKEKLMSPMASQVLALDQTGRTS
jgi:hypothetical protein